MNVEKRTKNLELSFEFHVQVMICTSVTTGIEVETQYFCLTKKLN